MAGLWGPYSQLGFDNWLTALFRVNAGIPGFSTDSLTRINPVDIILLSLASASFAGLWPGLGTFRKVGLAAAMAFPVIGIGVFLVTGLAGRSGLMAAGLAVSVLMMGRPRLTMFSITGIAANGLLLAGDFATTGGENPFVAGLIGAGYLLLIAWLLVMIKHVSSQSRTESP